MTENYTLEYLKEPIVKKDRGGKERSFDWSINRSNGTWLEPPNSVVFLFQSYDEARSTYDTLIGA